MSIHAHVPRVDHAPADALGAIVARAGGVLSTAGPGERPVVLHYGSPAGELAACVDRVGLANRSELVTLSIEGPQDMLARVLCHLTGTVLATGGAVQTGSSWWCAPRPDRVLAIAEPTCSGALRERIRALAARHPGLRVLDSSAQRCAIAVVGQLAPEMLASLGVYGPSGDPRTVAPASVRRLQGTEVTWLLQSDHRALAIVDQGRAAALWHALRAAGRPLRLCAVGQEAIARYTLLATTHLDL